VLLREVLQAHKVFKVQQVTLAAQVPQAYKERLAPQVLQALQAHKEQQV
jgi:hypothetical protein